MLIKVMYKDHRFDMIKPSLLKKLIIEDEIKMFYRSGEWVATAVDPLRGQGGTYRGHERRTAEEKHSESQTVSGSRR